MKKLYLFHLLLIATLASCKKTDNYFTGTPKIDNNTQGVNGGSTPTGPTSDPKLVNLRINGVSCAFDSTTNTYYYPVSTSENISGYTVNFDTTTAKTIFMDNARVNNGATAFNTLRTNENISIKVVNALNTARTYNLIITGLPIVNMNANGTIGDDRINASFDLIDPNYDLPGHKKVTSSNISVSIRGASSRYYPKRSYSLHLVNASGADTDASLLGLREDNNWILDAMFIDQARMRNRLCTDIWNSFNNVPHIDNEPDALNGTRGYMTEVFLNNKYQGVYCLTEKLDRKQIKIKKQYGRMYKADQWSNEVNFFSVSSFNNASPNWGGWAFEYPDIGDSPDPDWAPLYNLASFVSSSADDDFKVGIVNKVDINNMVDYFIFINAVAATDNYSKNTFLSYYDSRNSSSFFYSVWDLDASFGRYWEGSYFSNQVLGVGPNNLLNRLLTTDAGEFKTLVKERWNTLKFNQLSKAVVHSRIEGYRKVLISTNAFARERLLWSNIGQDLNVETDYMTKWYDGQYDLIDTYFNNL